MTIIEILKSENYKTFLIKNLTENQKESILLKYLIKIRAEELLRLNFNYEEIYRFLAVEGFEIINGNKTYLSKTTIKGYYLHLK